MPLNLLSLPNEPFGTKHPKISELIKLAIWGSPDHKLTLRQIYNAIEERYPSYKENPDKPWQVRVPMSLNTSLIMHQRSIRHNLSLKAMFIPMERPVSHPGKGYHWKLNIRMGEGNKLDRKRRDPKADRGLREEEDDYEFSDASSETAAPSTSMRGMQRRPVHVDSRMYPPPPQRPMSFGPGLMPQANPMFTQAAAGPYGGPYLTGSGILSPSQVPTYAMGPMAFPGHAPWEMQDPASAPEPAAYPDKDGSAHWRTTGEMPAQQHHAHEPDPPMSVANPLQLTQVPGSPVPPRTRQHHLDNSSEGNAEEVRRRPRDARL